nr:hypothetical protein [Tanacetum cinerariifolium]
MQKFWASAKLHHNSIRFKIDKRKSVLDLEAFREMLHISPRIPNQPFADLPTEEEVLDFLRFLGHSQDICYLTDVNVNKLYQPWRSFASVINKCLTGKSSGVDSFRLFQAQMLWGFYHRINIDFAYLIWEDFVYQVVSRHQATQQYGAILPTELTTAEIRNSKAYQEYYACAMEEAAPKPKSSARKKKGDSASSTTPPTPTPTTTAESAPRLSDLLKSRQETHISQQSGSGTSEGTGSKPGVSDVPSDDSEDELSWKSSDDEEVGSHEEGKESDDDSDEGSDKDYDETVKSGAGKDGDEDDDEDDTDDDEEEETAKDDEEDKETDSEKESDDEEEQESRLSEEARIQ